MTDAPLYEAPGLTPPPGGSAVVIRATDGTRLRASSWRRPASQTVRGTALLFQGRTEFVEKHYETVARLIGLGFDVVTVDWRGQGLSDRPLPDPRKGHVNDFAEFQLDVNALVAFARQGEAPEPWIVVAHSMGGAIASRALMRVARGGSARWRPQAAVLSAPMLGLAGSSPFLTVSKGAAGAAVAFGLAHSYAPGGSDQAYVTQGFAGNVLTSDRGRFDAYAELVRRRPELALGGPTWGWVRAAFSEMSELRPTRTPTLLALGSEEAVVSPEAIKSFASASPSARLRLLTGCRHEPFFETDAIQAQLWPEIDAFLKEQRI